MFGERVSPKLISSLIFLGVICFTRCSRYDINAECQRLFNADLYSVVYRFRRTPEYLKILEDRYEETLSILVDIEYRVFIHFLDRMQKRLAEIWEIDLNKDNNNQSTTTAKTTTTNGHALMLYFKSHRRTTMGLNNYKTHAERLDTYSLLNSSLSLAQRNAMKDLGFTYAENIIQAVVNHMGGGDIHIIENRPEQGKLGAAAGGGGDIHIIENKPEQGKLGAAAGAGGGPRLPSEGGLPSEEESDEYYTEYEYEYYDYVNGPKNVTGAAKHHAKKGNFTGKPGAQIKKKRHKKKKQEHSNTTNIKH